MGKEYCGIKRIDEAQRLLMKEYEENGLQFLLITRPKNKGMGCAFVGDSKELAAVAALYTKESDTVKDFINNAYLGMHWVQNKEDLK